MAFRFDNILENWATLYKPISHCKVRGAAEKRFFRIKMINADNEFARNANIVKSPCMLFSVLVDAKSEGNARSVSYRYEIYFAMKAVSCSLAKNPRQDEELCTDMQLAMDEMVQDLLAYLHTLRSREIDPLTKRPLDSNLIQGLRGLQLDRAEWASIPVMYNEWHVMGLSIEGITPRLQCVMPDKYNPALHPDPTH